MQRDEVLEVVLHRSHIARDKHSAGLSGNPQHFQIGGAVRNHAGGIPEIDGWFAAPQTSADVRIDVGVSLKSNLQEDFGDGGLFTASKHSNILAGIGY